MPSPLEERIKGQGISPAMLSVYTSLDPMSIGLVLQGRVTADSTAGATVLAFLDKVEHDGLPPLPSADRLASAHREDQVGKAGHPELWTVAQRNFNRENQHEWAAWWGAQAKARAEEDVAAILAARAEATARYKQAAVDAIDQGVALRATREAAGLSMVEMAAFLQASPEMLYRVERGNPHGWSQARVATVLAGYSAAAKLSKAAGRKVAK
jgi:hypothetical protein